MMEAIFAAADRQAKFKSAGEREWSLSEDQRQKLHADQRAFEAIIRENFGERLLGGLKQGGDGADWRKARSEGTARLPPQTKEDEARNQRIDREVNKFQQYMQALEEGVSRLVSIAVDNLLPWINSAMGLVSRFGKWIGLIPTTDEEKRNEMNAKVAEQQRRESVKATGEEYYGTVQAAGKISDTGGTGAAQARDLLKAWGAFSGARAKLENNRGDAANRTWREENVKRSLQVVLDAINALRAVRPDVVGGISQDTVGKNVGDAKSNFDNDQRTFTIPIHVTGFTKEDVAIMVKKAVLEAVAMGKGSNASFGTP